MTFLSLLRYAKIGIVESSVNNEELRSEAYNLGYEDGVRVLGDLDQILADDLYVVEAYLADGSIPINFPVDDIVSFIKNRGDLF